MMHSIVDPRGFRIPANKADFSSIWFTTDKKLRFQLVEDDDVVRYCIDNVYYNQKLAKVIIKREASTRELIVELYTDSPSSIYGFKGNRVFELRKCLKKWSIAKKINISVLYLNLSSRLIASDIALSLPKKDRVKLLFKIIKRLKFNRKLDGFKIQLKGRIGGVEKRQKKVFKGGSVPLHALNANIDYYCIPVNTVSGMVSVKVWINFKNESSQA